MNTSFPHPPYIHSDVSQPRAAKSTKPLPNARLVSSSLFATDQTPHRRCSMFMTLWGQFVYEDVVHLSQHVDNAQRPLGTEHIVNKQEYNICVTACCDLRVASHPECMTIAVADTDAVFGGAKTCMEYTRTATAPKENCVLGMFMIVRGVDFNVNIHRSTRAGKFGIIIH
jgi:hypothetical protein